MIRYLPRRCANNRFLHYARRFRARQYPIFAVRLPGLRARASCRSHDKPTSAQDIPMTPFVREASPVPTGFTAGALNVKLVTGNEVPADLLDRAKTLDSGGPFGRAAWWDSWWRHLRPRGSELFLLTVWQGDELVGLAPWYAQRAFGFGRVVRFL